VRLSPKQATPPSGNRASISKDRNPRLHLSKIRVLPDRRIPIAASRSPRRIFAARRERAAGRKQIASKEIPPQPFRRIFRLPDALFRQGKSQLPRPILPIPLGLTVPRQVQPTAFTRPKAKINIMTNMPKKAG